MPQVRILSLGPRKEGQAIWAWPSFLDWCGGHEALLPPQAGRQRRRLRTQPPSPFREFESCHSDHFRIGVDTFVSTPIFCIIDLLLPRKMMLYDPHFHVSKKIVCGIRKTCTRWGFRLKDKKEIVCEMGRPPLSGKLRLDFSAFLSIAILQAERLERRI